MTEHFYSEILCEYLKHGNKKILVMGNESNNNLYKFNKFNHDIMKISELFNNGQTADIMRANITAHVLRIGDDVDNVKVFNYYNGLVEEHGYVIMDNCKDTKFLNNCLGTYNILVQENNTLILQKKSIERDIKFAIVIACYHRSNGLSRFYVERALKYIKQQSYDNYKVFLIGDNYTNHEEFNQFKYLLPDDKICTVNLPIALERENCKIKRNLWLIGGANAMNHGIKLALNEKLYYYVHLDDDDYWYRHHLLHMATGYIQFPESEFVCNLGIMHNGHILPRIRGLCYNNFNCIGCSAFHSSYGFKLSTFNFLYNTLELDKPEISYTAADANMLDRINKECKEKSYKILGIPIITCFHDFEASILKGDTKNNINEHYVLTELRKEMMGSRSDLKYNYIASNIKTSRHNHILYDLRTILGNRLINYLEIGSFYGASLSLMVQHPYPMNLQYMNTFEFEGQEEKIKENVAKFNNYDRPLIVKSYDKNSDYFVDLLFINGDNRYQSVILNFINYSKFVNIGGFIVFNGYHDVEKSSKVKTAVDDIAKDIKSNPNSKFETIGHLSNKYNEFILRRIR